MPSPSLKISGLSLQHLPTHDLADLEANLPDEAALMHLDVQGLRHDFLWQPSACATQRLFVLFSGDAVRGRNAPPVFQRWSWADRFPGHCLYVSDPTLHLDRHMGLAWYAGTRDLDPLDAVASVVRRLSARLGLGEDRVVSYGSSGGGFAAMRLGLKLPELTMVAINPQTVVTAYHQKAVEKYLRICLGMTDRAQALAAWPERLSLLASIDRLRGRRLVYAQNTLDTHHHQDHYLPFCAALGVDPQPCDHGPMRRVLFADPGGHNKGETPQVFAQLMHAVEALCP